MHFEDTSLGKLYRYCWKLQRPRRELDLWYESPIRPRVHPLQRLTRLP